MCSGDDDKVPNEYLASLRDTKPGVETRAGDLEGRLKSAKNALAAGAWIGGESDDFGLELDGRIEQLGISASMAVEEFTTEINTQSSEPEVDKGTWRATWPS
ncbi:hypothetical protein [Brevibacterium samyangense]|uniref:Uncharacterized protein n=1 Tax=Brevibacterium samyangense TaxID=366888 RepID=A0ABP5EHX6_9MICO